MKESSQMGRYRFTSASTIYNVQHNLARRTRELELAKTIIQECSTLLSRVADALCSKRVALFTNSELLIADVLLKSAIVAYDSDSDTLKRM